MLFSAYLLPGFFSPYFLFSPPFYFLLILFSILKAILCRDKRTNFGAMRPGIKTKCVNHFKLLASSSRSLNGCPLSQPMFSFFPSSHSTFGTPVHPLRSSTAGILVLFFWPHVLPPCRAQFPSDKRKPRNCLPGQLTQGLNRERCTSRVWLLPRQVNHDIDQEDRGPLQGVKFTFNTGIHPQVLPHDTIPRESPKLSPDLPAGGPRSMTVYSLAQVLLLSVGLRQQEVVRAHAGQPQ